MRPITEAKERVEYRLTYAKTVVPREFLNGILRGPDIPDAHEDGKSPGEWFGGESLDEEEATVEDCINHFADMALQEGVHEVLEWFRVDEKPWIDPHGELESEVHKAVETLTRTLIDLRAQALASSRGIDTADSIDQTATSG